MRIPLGAWHAVYNEEDTVSIMEYYVEAIQLPEVRSVKLHTGFCSKILCKSLCTGFDVSALGMDVME